MAVERVECAGWTLAAAAEAAGLSVRMTGAEIAETLGMPVSTVSGILTRIGWGKL